MDRKAKVFCLFLCLCFLSQLYGHETSPWALSHLIPIPTDELLWNTAGQKAQLKPVHLK